MSCYVMLCYVKKFVTIFQEGEMLCQRWVRKATEVGVSDTCNVASKLYLNHSRNAAKISVVWTGYLKSHLK